MPHSCDVLVIGAGAAGLSACRDLSTGGVDVLCVEARDRIGGRILTVTDPLSPLPIELGPEFIHGRPPESWDLIRAGVLTVYDCAEHAVHIVDGKIEEESDSWDQVAAITEAMKKFAARGGDLPFSEFIEKTDFADEAKELATSYVEGFNAARKERISVASLALDSKAAEKISGDRNFRLASGYDSFLRTLQAQIDESHCRLQLNTVVEEVRWSAGKGQIATRSQLTGQADIISARRVMVTLPLGVLQAPFGAAGSVRFVPHPERLQAAVHSLCFGHVMRLVMRFRHPWWEDKPGLADAGFWLSQERHFPTWWTALPVRSPLLTGWSAGPHADLMIGQSKEQVVTHALSDLAKISGHTVLSLRELLAVAHFHDWQADPFSRGAYSYVPAGAVQAREQLAVPFENTLFFAGEATETCGHSATVHGAIASGRRAAHQVLASL